MRVRQMSREQYYYEEGGRRVNLWELVAAPEEFFRDTRRSCLTLLKPILEQGLEVLRDRAIGVAAYDRGVARQDRRNGYYTRQAFATALGRIERLRVPRCRKRQLMAEVHERLRQAQGALEDQVVEMYLKGVSTRNVGQLLDGLVGVSVSAGQVSHLARRLDALVGRFHQRSLEDRYVYLFLDGIYLKSRHVPPAFRPVAAARRRVVLAAYGVTRQGIKELIDFRVEAKEDAAGWGRFLLSLWRRGLQGAALRLIVSDGGKGVLAAVGDVYPEAPHQRCWFHKMSNVASKVKKRHAAACLQGLRAVYQAPTRRAAERAYTAWARRWQHPEPAAVRCVAQDLEALLRFYAVPAAHRKMVRTSNAIERCFREVRRRTRSIGTFVDQASLERLVYGLFDSLNRRRAQQVCREFRSTQVAA
jgi:putative transposase